MCEQMCLHFLTSPFSYSEGSILQIHFFHFAFFHLHQHILEITPYQFIESILIFKNFIYLFLMEREREHGRGRERERERERENLKQAPHHHLGAQCGAGTHEPWDHDLSQSWTLNRLSHPGASVAVPKSLLSHSLSYGHLGKFQIFCNYKQCCNE